MPFPDWDNPPLTLGSFSSKLPDPGAYFGPAALPGTTPSGIPELWGRRALEGATALSGYFLQNVALIDGWPNSLDILDNIDDTGLLNIGQQVIGGLAGELSINDPNLDPIHIATAVIALLQKTGLLNAALEPSLQQLQALLAEAIGGALLTGAQIVPIVGWAIALVRGTVSLSRQVKENNEAGFGILPGTVQGLMKGVVPSFNRARNDDAANALLEVLKGDDWTEVWMPSTAPWSKLALDITDESINIDGWMIGAGLVDSLATGIPMPAGVWAAIPGVAQLGGAFYMVAADAPEGFVLGSYADVVPSANQLAGMAWMRMQTISGQCCNAKLKMIENAWGVWQGRGREFLESEAMQPSGDLAPYIRGARYLADAARGSPYHDGEPFVSPLYPPKRRPENAYVADRVRAACKKQRERIWLLLGTIACAYVPPDAPALQEDLELKLRYAAMRKKLLTHPARWRVELALVPDAAYRQMLFDATIGSTLAAPDVLPKHDAPIDGGPEPLPPELPDVPGGLTGEPPEGGGSGWLALLALAAIAVFVLWRWGKR